MNRVPTRHRRRLASAIAVLGAAAALSGCGVMMVAGAAAGAVVSTGVKVTGKVVEKTIDVVTPGSSGD